MASSTGRVRYSDADVKEHSAKWVAQKLFERDHKQDSWPWALEKAALTPNESKCREYCITLARKMNDTERRIFIDYVLSYRRANRAKVQEQKLKSAKAKENAGCLFFAILVIGGLCLVLACCDAVIHDEPKSSKPDYRAQGYYEVDDGVYNKVGDDNHKYFIGDDGSTGVLDTETGIGVVQDKNGNRTYVNFN